MPPELPIVTKSRLMGDLAALGVQAGQTIMLHVSVKAIGWIVGGPEVVLSALLDLLTPEGTLMMYVAWEDCTDDLRTWPAERQEAYLAECPAFDPATTRANREWSILTEYLRTWPGAYRSANPGASMAAVGALAHYLTENHPIQYGYGPGSPLEKLCQLGGRVLQVGVSPDTVTLLHYTEHMADVPNKRIVSYPAPILVNGQRAWVEIEEFDTGSGIVDWDVDYFGVIVEEYLAAGKGRTGKVGAAQARLLEAAELHAYGVRWMKEHLTRASNPGGEKR
jgi:aminoglycoside 3-N-acetyltransferase